MTMAKKKIERNPAAEKIAQAMANMGVGNDREFLIHVISQCIPYIGYPRTLNAITCIRNADEMRKNQQ